jgi:hypothetical protein
MRGRAESSGPTSSAHDQADVGPLLASQGLVWLSPDSRSWGCALDEWLPRRRRAEGDRRQARGGREAGTRWSSGWEAGAARGFSWYTDRCVAEGIAVRVLTAVDQHTCLFPANLQSPAMESFHAALQIARALCTVPPRIAAPEHAVLDFSTVGRSAHRVIRAQLAALLRDTQRHLDRRDAVSADTALKHVSSTWRVRTPRSSVWSFYLTRRPACSHAPCCHQVNRMTKRMCGHTRFVIMIHPQHHCRVHTRYLMRYTPTGGDRLLSRRSPAISRFVHGQALC